MSLHPRGLTVGQTPCLAQDRLAALRLTTYESTARCRRMRSKYSRYSSYDMLSRLGGSAAAAGSRRASRPRSGLLLRLLLRRRRRGLRLRLLHDTAQRSASKLSCLSLGTPSRA